MRGSLLLLLLYLLVWSVPAAADDTEAYVYPGTTQSTFVHVVMDLGDSQVDAPLCTFGVNCGPPFMTAEAYRHLGDMYGEGESVTAPGVFRAVLAAVLENPLLDNLRLSLLISNHQDNPKGDPSIDDPAPGSGGGTLLQGYLPLQTHRAELIAALKSVPILASGNTHMLQPAETYFEWLRYIGAGDVALGRNTRGNFGEQVPQPDYDGSIINDNDQYLTPFTETLTCPKLYSILFTQGVSNRDNDLDAEIAAQFPDLSQVSFTQLLSYLHGGDTDLLSQVDASVPLQKTWVVSSRDRAGSAPEFAVAGGSEAPLYVNEPVALQERLTSALVESMPVAGVSLQTVFTNDVFNQGQALDTVFVPQFLPRSHTNWPGNLKKLKLHKSSGGDSSSGDGQFDQVVDAHGEPAYEPLGEQKGQLRKDALTFWTDPTTLSRGNGETVPDAADGPVVTRGGAGQKIDGFVRYSLAQGEFAQHFIGDTNADTPVDGYGPRQLFYEPQSGQELQPFDANAATVTELGSLLDPDDAMTEAQRLDLVKWARGQDVDNGTSTARGWLLGEVVHSTPLALNYGATRGYSEENPNVRVLFGSGDGAFHIVENTATSGRESGREVFGFFPRETLSIIPWRRQGTGTSTGTSANSGLARRYGVDGAPVVLRVDLNGDGTLDAAAGDEAYAYFGLRRGGHSYFALDVSNPDAVPTLKWKISRSNGGDFDELGLTFATPLVGKVNYSGVPVDVLVFAGGYDGGWNEDYSARHGKDFGADDDAVGNAIYIVNARTGELVWKAVRGETGTSSDTRYQHAGMVDSIPSAVSALLTPAGIIHRFYVGDSGGAVWRVDLPPNLNGRVAHRRDRWFITKLADLGADAAESGGSVHDDRRFFHAPDLVQSYDAAGDFDGVLIQSGNREDPNETLVANALFYLKDREVVSGSGDVRAENDVETPAGRYRVADLPDRTHCMDDSGEETGDDSGDCARGSTERGWQFRFEQPGEKGLSTPLTDGGRVLASTFTPAPSSPCFPRRGQGRLYVLRLRDAAAAANHVKHYELGDGIPAAAMPVGEVIFLPGGGIELHDLDGDGERDASQFLPSEAGKLYRTYWREPGADPL